MDGRIVLHIDFDHFYAALEELRRPELRGKAVVVCVYSGRSEDSGAVATANYRARELGIRSGMPISKAKSLGKDKAVFIPTDMDYYRKASERIMDFLREKPEAFEQTSIDEAYMDFTGKVAGYEEAANIAVEIKKQIKEKEKITCSIGIGPNKLVAKMASKEKKPDGLAVVRPQEARSFLFQKPVSKLFGVGSKSLEIFNKSGIKTIKDLAEHDVKILEEKLGKTKARLLWERANGIDDSPVEESERQQASRIATLGENTRDFEKIRPLISRLSEDVHRKILKQGKNFRTVSVISINTRLETKTKSRTLNHSSCSLEDIKKHSAELMEKFLSENPEEVLRRCGVSVSGFGEKQKQAAAGQRTLVEY